MLFSFLSVLPDTYCRKLRFVEGVLSSATGEPFFYGSLMLPVDNAQVCSLVHSCEVSSP
jgi:hypothetical protein